VGRLMLALALALALSGCIWEDDADVTCNNFNAFLHDCTANCSPNWNCESNYHTLPVADQIDLDECSDCMAASPTCADCSVPGVPSCWDFMEALLGVDCW